MAKIKVKLEDWLEYLESQVNVTLYVWGANDELCVNLLNKLTSMEKSLNDVDRTLTLLQKRLLQGCDMLKIRCADCSGLAMGFLIKTGILKNDTTADGLYKLLMDRQIPIKDVKAGDYLFQGSESKKTHVGYAISNKYAIESQNHDVGVVQTKIADRPWRWACRPDWYTDSEPIKPVLTRELYYIDNKPLMHGEDVKDAQILLDNKGYNPGTVDGIFGKKTEIAVKNFQTDNGLTVDGIIGKNTATALGFKWEG